MFKVRLFRNINGEAVELQPGERWEAKGLSARTQVDRLMLRSRGLNMFMAEKTARAVNVALGNRMSADGWLTVEPGCVYAMYDEE